MVTSDAATGRRRGVCCELPAPATEAWAEQCAALLKALADPTRLSMVATLRQMAGPVCICDFTAAYELSQPTISHHMARLRSAGLVEASKQGIWIYYRLRADMAPAIVRLLDAVLSAH
jgi:ArsR family transcriptional regulator